MKLYLKPGACSQAVHIVLLEMGQSFETEWVDTEKQLTSTGRDFRQINSKGYVPVLALNDQVFLSEGPAILQYLADSDSETVLAPRAGSLERAQLNALLNYLSSEVHKSFAPFFSSTKMDEEALARARQLVLHRLSYLETLLETDQSFLFGDSFTVADALAVVLLSWAGPCDIELKVFLKLQAYYSLLCQRESVKEARRRERPGSQAA